MGEAVAKLSSAAASGQKVSATMYPYAAGGTRLAAVLPLWAQEGGNDAMLARLADPAQRARMRKEVEGTTEGWENLLMAATFDGVQIASVPAEYDQSVVGKRLGEIAAARKADPWDVLFEIIVGTKGRAGALYHMMSEADVRTGLAARFVSIGTDSAAIRHEGPLAQGQPHPRAYGTFPRVLGHYVRDEKVLTLEDAVHRMTGLAAEQFQIRDRGVIREGAFADLVVFDPATVADTATYERPHSYPRGIEHVIVNGMPALGPQGLTGALPGRALHGPGRTRPWFVTPRPAARTTGGDLCLPDPKTIMIDRADGGQLVVNPPRRVWERTALTPAGAAVAWNLLVAAAGRAMLECLPQLEGGCLNYWDAGNWALNAAAEPAGEKRGPDHRVLHQHVIGRSRRSADPDWRWGESPFFPAFADRFAWSTRQDAADAWRSARRSWRGRARC